MESKSSLDIDHDFFSGTKKDGVLQIKFKKNLILQILNIQKKEYFFNYLKKASEDNSVKVVLIIGSPEKLKSENYISFYQKLVKLSVDHSEIERFYNAINQLVLIIIGMKKLVIHADIGRIIPLFLSISFACDYRIIAENAVFENPNMDINIMPKGGVVQFIARRLGRSKATELFLLKKNIDASEALNLQLVDCIAPTEELTQRALETAERFAQNQLSYIEGMKKLINYDINNFSDYLEYENTILRKIVTSTSFQNQIAQLGTITPNINPKY